MAKPKKSESNDELRSERDEELRSEFKDVIAGKRNPRARTPKEFTDEAAARARNLVRKREEEQKAREEAQALEQEK